jgi:hypothetical protein
MITYLIVDVDEFWPYRHRHHVVGSLLIVIGSLLLVGGLLWAYKATNNTWWILGNPPERNPTDYPYPFWVFMGTYFAIGYLCTCHKYMRLANLTFQIFV